MSEVEVILRGRVESGEGDAQRWLGQLNAAYTRKARMAVFPGSLNVRLTELFDWFSEGLPSPTIRFPREENGGERDILLLPCVFPELDSLPGYLWTTTHGVGDPAPTLLVEVIAPVSVRAEFGVVDGTEVEIHLVAERLHQV